jgi:hypothetical protein
LAIDHKTEKVENRSWSSNFSLSSFVALADVLIRKLIKAKPTHGTSLVDSPSWENLLVQAEVLNIVERCEAKWNGVNWNNEAQQPLFDPVCLQRELTKRIRRLTDKSQAWLIETEFMTKESLSEFF